MLMPRHPSRSILICVVPAVLAACASSPAKPVAVEPTPSPEVRSSSEVSGLYDACVALFERQRECTDVFLPALVEARVRHDVPRGIAERDRAEGRDALLAGAEEEWQVDSTDEAIATICGRIEGQAPDGAALIERAEACLGESDCGGFTECALEIAVAQWRH
jgi:hypothetical protein